MPHFIYPFSCRWLGIIFTFGYYGCSFCEHSYSSCGYTFLFLLKRYLGTDFLSKSGELFKETVNYFPKWVHHFRFSSMNFLHLTFTFHSCYHLSLESEVFFNTEFLYLSLFFSMRKLYRKFPTYKWVLFWEKFRKSDSLVWQSESYTLLMQCKALKKSAVRFICIYKSLLLKCL